MQGDRQLPLGRIICYAGLAGGWAELGWIALYSGYTQASGLEVARQITVTLFPALAHAAGAVPLGIAIHFALSLLLAAAYAKAVWLPHAFRHGAVITLVGSFVILGLVWLINFFVVLPALNPAFVGLMPYWATLLSKLWFAAALAAVLNGAASAPDAAGVRRTRQIHPIKWDAAER